MVSILETERKVICLALFTHRGILDLRSAIASRHEEYVAYTNSEIRLGAGFHAQLHDEEALVPTMPSWAE